MRAIVRKDLTVVFRNRGVRIPLIVAPIAILVLLPVVLVTGGALIEAQGIVPQAPDTVSGTVSPGEHGAAAGFVGMEAWAVFVLEVFVAPLYLLVPLIVATVIAADSFAGERERGSLEALLHTPTTDDELFTAKVLAAWLPAVAVGLGGFLVYTVVANVLAWPYIGQLWFPTPAWLALALWVSPALAGLGLGVMVLVSSRVESLQSAHQIGALVIIPILLLVIGQLTGAVYFSVQVVLISGTVVWGLVAVFLKIAGRRFVRDQLAARV